MEESRPEAQRADRPSISPGGTGTSPTREPRSPGAPKQVPPRARVHHDRPPAGAALLRVGAPHHLDDPVHPLSRIGVGPEHQFLPEKPVADRRDPDPGGPAPATPGRRRIRRRDRYAHITAVPR